MVYFNCNACGLGLKKNQIEKHLFSCNTKTLSCIDCGQDFRKDEYFNHNKCISEAKKYESKSYVEKTTKGEAKQMAWFEKCLATIDNSCLNPKLKFVFEKLREYPNIPRKKNKFMNFVKNSLRSLNINDQLIEEMWSFIERNENKSTNKRSITDGEPESCKKLKTIISEVPSIDSNNQLNHQKSDKKFKIFDIIKQILAQRETKEMDFMKLKKKVLKQYEALSDDTKIDDAKVHKKLLKKLEKYSEYFEIHKDENEEILKIKLIDG